MYSHVQLYVRLNIERLMLMHYVESHKVAAPAPVHVSTDRKFQTSTMVGDLKRCRFKMLEIHSNFFDSLNQSN
ncbi:hypothetical protein Bhyg_10163 [Pseudolycoriella hygida]|uniref:Uncharacterized protein n=1 Tax=Pseudolycoriella hygida TaxID=35572 RepID=A0A9Q0MT00_9DIPT|nr:hypothetical protein Bhyg_10163 [Pseudolycoriella hygida]